MQIVPFDIEHVKQIGGNVEMYGGFAQRGPAYTLMNDQPVFCGGGISLWPGVAEIWVLPGPDIRKYMKSVFKAANEMITDGWTKLNLHRAHATIKATDVTSLGWIKHFGFEQEGYMKKFGPTGKDYILFARYAL